MPRQVQLRAQASQKKRVLEEVALDPQVHPLQKKRQRLILRTRLRQRPKLRIRSRPMNFRNTHSLRLCISAVKPKRQLLILRSQTSHLFFCYTAEAQRRRGRILAGHLTAALYLPQPLPISWPWPYS